VIGGRVIRPARANDQPHQDARMLFCLRSARRRIDSARRPLPHRGLLPHTDPVSHNQKTGVFRSMRGRRDADGAAPSPARGAPISRSNLSPSSVLRAQVGDATHHA